ncbi:DUF559 domain-containing protein [Nocardiopsis suaedae]|uniref:DUF559 domain-containing protein n=1 Tax=Nocardiopsis suaedae TaxID=3018444 RepID=A0ABT4TXI6_9ACTN|nr:DUF559 domain-containing protein [Nocardiopsis suaedae]MDA2808970.1 DUF559 domain-containing protein [Nocardiopsis suaedae]
MPLWPDVYAHADADPDSLRTRAAGLLLRLPPGSVISGTTAARLLGADYGASGAPVAAMVPGGERVPALPGADIHRAGVLPCDVAVHHAIRLTAPVRTALELTARTAGGIREGVATLNTLLAVRAGNEGLTPLLIPAEFLRFASQPRFRGMRGIRRAVATVGLAGPRVESPVESRLLADLVAAGLPVPEVQYELRIRGRTFFADLAYPQVRTVIEYDGECHAARREPDAERRHRIEAAGYRYFVRTKRTRARLLPEVVAEVRRAFGAAGQDLPTVPLAGPKSTCTASRDRDGGRRLRRVTSGGRNSDPNSAHQT